MIDVDHSNSLERDETIKFWAKNYPNLNTNELFDKVDKNNDNSIQLSEWLDFWVLVLKSGHTEEEISSELDNLLSGGSWVKFENVDNTRWKQSDIKNHGKY